MSEEVMYVVWASVEDEIDYPVAVYEDRDLAEKHAACAHVRRAELLREFEGCENEIPAGENLWDSSMDSNALPINYGVLEVDIGILSFEASQLEPEREARLLREIGRMDVSVQVAEQRRVIRDGVRKSGSSRNGNVLRLEGCQQGSSSVSSILEPV